MAMNKLKRATMLLLTLGFIGSSAGIATLQAQAGKQDQAAQSAEQWQGAAQVRTDLYGDSLPPGALARMGSMRLRHVHNASPISVAFSRDGKLLASGGMYEIRLWDWATGKLLREIHAGNRTMNCILEFAPDGQRLAGAGTDSTCIWEIATGLALHEFPQNGESVAWSPDGKLLAVFSRYWEGPIVVWDATTGGQVAQLRAGQKKKDVRSPRFTANGKGVITSAGALVSHWDLASQKLTRAVDVPPAYSWFFASPNGQIAVVFPRDRQQPVALWDMATDKEPLKLHGEPEHQSLGLAFSHDGKTLAMHTGNTEDPDKISIALWNTKTGEARRRFQLPTRHVTSLRFSPDDRTLVTTDNEPLIRLWDLETGREVLQRPGHVDSVSSLAFTPEGRSLVSCSLDRTVRLWDVASGRQVRELAGHRWRCERVAVAPDGKTILSGGSDGCLRVQDLDGKQLRRILLDGPPEEQTKLVHQFLAVGITPDGRTAATYSRDPNGRSPALYHLWDLATGKELGSRPDTSRIQGSPPEFSSDGRFVLESLYEERTAPPGAMKPGAGGRPGAGGPELTRTAVLREVATGKEVRRLRDPDGYSSSLLALAPDGRTGLTMTHRQEKVKYVYRNENTFHLWEVATGKERLTFSHGPAGHAIQRIAYAPDGRMLATAGNDGTIQFWDLTTGKELSSGFTADTFPREVLRDEVACLAFSPDAKLLATGRSDGTILVWKAASAEQPAGKADAVQLEQWWADLSADDARRAYSAVCGLSAQPEAVRFFRNRLRPAAEGPCEQIRQLIAYLDSSDFLRRKAASKQLAALDEQAAPALRAALQAKPSPEQRQRIEQLLSALDVVQPSETLRHLRALEVLERIGTTEAQTVVRVLSKGVPEARLTREAKACLERLAKRMAPRP
jgi:WD40 repeat protein